MKIYECLQVDASWEFWWYSKRRWSARWLWLYCSVHSAHLLITPLVRLLLLTSSTGVVAFGGG